MCNYHLATGLDSSVSSAAPAPFYEQRVAAPLLWKGDALAVSQLVIPSSLIGAEGPDSDDALHLLPVVARY